MPWSDLLNKKSNSNGGDSTGKKIEYVSIPVGSVKLRVLDEEPESRWTHWIPQANGGKGMSVACIGKGCPVCALISDDKKNKRKTKYGSSKSHAINVLTKSVTTGGTTTPINKVQLLDKGNKIFEGMLVIMQQMGDLRNYDITINRTGEEFGSITYTVLPTFPPTALTPEEVELANNKYDLKEITKPFTKEQIDMLLNGATLDTVVGTSPASEGTQSVDFTRTA